jgi:hypothetical protein
MAYGWLGAVGPLYGLGDRGIENLEELLKVLRVAASELVTADTALWGKDDDSVG